MARSYRVVIAAAVCPTQESPSATKAALRGAARRCHAAIRLEEVANGTLL